MDRDQANAERALVVVTLSTATLVAVFTLVFASMQVMAPFHPYSYGLGRFDFQDRLLDRALSHYVSQGTDSVRRVAHTFSRPLCSQACNHRSVKIFLPEMADHWTEELRCPMCYRAAWAELSQEDCDHTPIADRVPDGFEIIRTRHSIDFICSSCRVRVEP